MTARAHLLWNLRPRFGEINGEQRLSNTSGPEDGKCLALWVVTGQKGLSVDPSPLLTYNQLVLSSVLSCLSTSGFNQLLLGGHLSRGWELVSGSVGACPLLFYRSLSLTLAIVPLDTFPLWSPAIPLVILVGSATSLFLSFAVFFLKCSRL